MESDYSDAIHCASSLDRDPWIFHFYVNEIKALSSSLKVSFSHVGQSANSMANFWPNKGG